MVDDDVRGRCCTRRAALVSLACAGVTLAGCQATHQARKATPSGFLGDYSQLKEGEGDEAMLIYIAPDAQWSKYRKMLMEPVSVWANDELAKMSRDDLQDLVNYADHAVREALKDDYEFVDQPGPDVLRLRIAITEAKGSKVVLDTISSIVPQMRLVSGVKRLATGTGSFVGGAGMEAEILDSTTNRRLAAAVDRRAGQKRVAGVLDKWDDVKGAYDYWAQRLKTRLTEMRGVA